jgi:hypothetical protein
MGGDGVDLAFLYSEDKARRIQRGIERCGLCSPTFSKEDAQRTKAFRSKLNQMTIRAFAG